MPSALLETLGDVVRRRSDHVAVEDDAGSLTYGELWRRAAAVSEALAAGGARGARVGLLAPPGAAWVEAFLGCLRAGATVVALTELHPERELRALVAASGAKALVATESSFHLATIVAGNARVLAAGALGSGRPCLEAGSVAPPGDDADALLLFTSGTTGRPKGVPITHASVLSLGRTLASAWGFGERDVLLHALPLHHVHGIEVALVVALVAGARVCFLPRFDAARVWEALGSATAFMGVPTQHKKLFDALDAAPPEASARWTAAARGLRLVTSGSAALPAALAERWRALAGQYPLERYGMTEIGIVLSNPLVGERRPGTVGRALPGVEIRIAGDAGEPLPDGTPGEIWVRAPTVFRGYDGDDAATVAAFHDGWFRTGDTATRAPDGYVTILGRTSVDILKSGGEKLSALEIEDVLREHPDVADVAVVGFPDGTWGEIAVAVVVARAHPNAHEALTEPSLRAWAKARLAPFKVPKRVVLRDDLPRNALGKVMKPELLRTLRDQLG
jgi:malonyl-CoA/methylmalonyl-CoA synthetase